MHHAILREFRFPEEHLVKMILAGFAIPPGSFAFGTPL
jgi:hypothetical protein